METPIHVAPLPLPLHYGQLWLLNKKSIIHVAVCLLNSLIFVFSVNDGDYIKAVLDRNVAENISRVLYPNDNVRFILGNLL